MFINEIELAIKLSNITLSEGANDYFNELKQAKEKELITEKGKKILRFMRENSELYNKVFTAKNIGEHLEITSRSVSGSMNKLVTNNLVTKIGQNPVCYSLTDLGNNIEIND